jgi:hypothetical protein
MKFVKVLDIYSCDITKKGIDWDTDLQEHRDEVTDTVPYIILSFPLSYIPEHLRDLNLVTVMQQGYYEGTPNDNRWSRTPHSKFPPLQGLELELFNMLKEPLEDIKHSFSLDYVNYWTSTYLTFEKVRLVSSCLMT